MPKLRKSIALLLVLIVTVTNSIPAFAALDAAINDTAVIDTGQQPSVTRFTRDSNAVIKPLSTKDVQAPKAEEKVSGVTRFVRAENVSGDPTLLIQGKQSNLEKGDVRIFNNNPVVPVEKFDWSLLGLKYTWDAKAKELNMTDGDVELSMKVGEPYIWVNESHRIRSDTLQIIDKILYAPLKQIVGNYKYLTYTWDSAVMDITFTDDIVNVKNYLHGVKDLDKFLKDHNSAYPVMLVDDEILAVPKDGWVERKGIPKTTGGVVWKSADVKDYELKYGGHDIEFFSVPEKDIITPDKFKIGEFVNYESPDGSAVGRFWSHPFITAPVIGDTSKSVWEKPEVFVVPYEDFDYKKLWKEYTPETWGKLSDEDKESYIWGRPLSGRLKAEGLAISGGSYDAGNYWYHTATGVIYVHCLNGHRWGPQTGTRIDQDDFTIVSSAVKPYVLSQPQINAASGANVSRWMLMKIASGGSTCYFGGNNHQYGLGANHSPTSHPNEAAISERISPYATGMKRISGDLKDNSGTAWTSGVVGKGDYTTDSAKVVINLGSGFAANEPIPDAVSGNLNSSHKATKSVGDYNPSSPLSGGIPAKVDVTVVEGDAKLSFGGAEALSSITNQLIKSPADLTITAPNSGSWEVEIRIRDAFLDFYYTYPRSENFYIASWINLDGTEPWGFEGTGRSQPLVGGFLGYDHKITIKGNNPSSCETDCKPDEDQLNKTIEELTKDYHDKYYDMSVQENWWVHGGKYDAFPTDPNATTHSFPAHAIIESEGYEACPMPPDGWMIDEDNTVFATLEWTGTSATPLKEGNKPWPACNDCYEWVRGECAYKRTTTCDNNLTVADCPPGSPTVTTKEAVVGTDCAPTDANGKTFKDGTVTTTTIKNKEGTFDGNKIGSTCE